MSMNNIQANCWLFYLIKKRCNQTSINQWLKWTHALQQSLSGHLTSSLPPSLSAITNHQDIILLSSLLRVCSSAPYGREHHMCPAWKGPWISVLWIHVTCFVRRCGQGGGFHTDRINMWKWLTRLYVSDVLGVLYISWEAFSKDMINLQNMVNFPSAGYSWLSASFVDCLACPYIASYVCRECVCVCVRARMCPLMCMQTYVCVCITPV